MYGECTNKECKIDHSDDKIQNKLKKVWGLTKAVKTPGGEVLVAELCQHASLMGPSLQQSYREEPTSFDPGAFNYLGVVQHLLALQFENNNIFRRPD